MEQRCGLWLLATLGRVSDPERRVEASRERYRVV
jgi:hypothetical protein